MMEDPVVVSISRLDVAAYTVPTTSPEADGTLEWDRTTIVVVEATAGGVRGIGFSYTSSAAAPLIRDLLAEAVLGCDPMDIGRAWAAMVRRVRNVGRPGIASTAIAAVDTALWDLKARLLGLSLSTLIGRVRDEVPIYGSGGFTSYSVAQLQAQLSAWVEDGISRVKMKVAGDIAEAVNRVRAAREAIGPRAELFVDANGAYGRKQALAAAEGFANSGVSWFEEPVSSDDLHGLRLLRDRAPAGMDVAAGEYGYDLSYFANMLDAVDVVQADATRCAGITGFLEVGALCAARSMPLSSHTAPSLHVHACCALRAVRHLEYFHDHVHIEQLLFDGVATPVNGMLRPDLTRPGLGIELKRTDAARFAL